MKHQTSKAIFYIIPAVLALAAAAALYVLLYQQIGASADRARAAVDIVQAAFKLLFPPVLCTPRHCLDSGT